MISTNRSNYRFNAFSSVVINGILEYFDCKKIIHEKNTQNIRHTVYLASNVFAFEWYQDVIFK